MDNDVRLSNFIALSDKNLQQTKGESVLLFPFCDKRAGDHYEGCE